MIRARGRIELNPEAYYFISLKAYLVPAGSTIQSIDEVNREGILSLRLPTPPPRVARAHLAPLATVEEVAGVDLIDGAGAERRGRCLRAVA